MESQEAKAASSRRRRRTECQGATGLRRARRTSERARRKRARQDEVYDRCVYGDAASPEDGTDWLAGQRGELFRAIFTCFCLFVYFPLLAFVCSSFTQPSLIEEESAGWGETRTVLTTTADAGRPTDRPSGARGARSD